MSTQTPPLSRLEIATRIVASMYADPTCDVDRATKTRIAYEQADDLIKAAALTTTPEVRFGVVSRDRVLFWARKYFLEGSEGNLREAFIEARSGQ